MAKKSNEMLYEINIPEMYGVAYTPKNDKGELVTSGRSFRQQARRKSDDLIEQNLTPIDVGFLPQTSDSNKKLNRIYNRRNRWKKVGEAFTKLMMNAAMADAPAVMQASGYVPTSDGNVVYAPSEASEQLAKNLAVLGNTVSTGLGMGLGIATSGVIPTLVSTAAGTAGSYAGGKVGEALDKKYDTK